jgi:hypothetical protein
MAITYTWNNFIIDEDADGNVTKITGSYTGADGDHSHTMERTISILAETGETIPVSELTREKCIEIFTSFKDSGDWETIIQDEVEDLTVMASRTVL